MSWDLFFVTVNVCADEFEDNTFQHSCGLSFTGLKMMVDKDAERENDGEAMMSHWRINMNAFHNNNHNKYLILGHRLLSGKDQYKVCNTDVPLSTFLLKTPNHDAHIYQVLW